ncbi:MAG: winged helix DNA-binding domain-containing protein [Acidimicrobiia bacterium]|nr:winged helix DNA-binding domain-containing protein [Acidimicrobiia bacterium]
MTRRIGPEERRARLGRRHHLAAPTGDVVGVAGDLAGLHSSDPATVYLSLWARVGGFVQADLDTALYDRRTLLRVLGMRRTMFVAPLDMTGEMQASCAAELAPAQRRRVVKWLTDQGIGDEEWVADVCRRTLAALASLGEATAMELREVVPELRVQIDAGKYGTFGMSTRILWLLAVEGAIVRTRPLGSWVSTRYRWIRMEDWIEGGLPAMDPGEAAACLVRRWLAAFGPGTEKDVSWWTGWGLGKTRVVLRAVGAVEVDLDGETGFVLPDDVEPVSAPEPWVALLPALDPTTMGWKQREWYLGGHTADLFDRNGNAGPTVWADGRVVGAWTQREGGEIVSELLEPVESASADAIADEVVRLREWLGDRRVRPRFPTPLEQRLRA